jgi:hypothetical protein
MGVYRGWGSHGVLPSGLVLKDGTLQGNPILKRSACEVPWFILWFSQGFCAKGMVLCIQFIAQCSVALKSPQHAVNARGSVFNTHVPWNVRRFIKCLILAVHVLSNVWYWLFMFNQMSDIGCSCFIKCLILAVHVLSNVWYWLFMFYQMSDNGCSCLIKCLILAVHVLSNVW